MGGVTRPKAQLDYAGRQRMLVQKMAKEAALVAQGVDLENSVSSLRDTMDFFANSHSALIRGVTATGLAPTEEVCTLEAMSSVSYSWDYYRPLMIQIVYDKAASNADMELVSQRCDDLEVFTQTALDHYMGGLNCSITPTDAEWINLINMAGFQGMLVQRTSRVFFQIVKAVNPESSQITLSETIASCEDNIRQLIEGDIGQSVTVAPTQTIVDGLALVWEAWEDFSGTVSEISSSDNPTDLGSQTQIAISTDSLACLELAIDVAEMYVEVAVLFDSSAPVHVLNLAGRQRMLIEKMGKEAVLLSLGVDVPGNTEHMADSMQLFTKTHHDLLAGNETLGLDVTTDHCILQQMQGVWDLWEAYESLLQTAVADTTNTISDVLESIDSDATPFFVAMDVAVSYYAAGEGVCTREITTTNWKMMLLKVTSLGMWTQRIGTAVCLAARDLNMSVSTTSLETSAAEFTDALSMLRYGSTPDTISAPPTDVIVYQILVLYDLWTSLQDVLFSTTLTAAAASAIVSDVLEQCVSLLQAVDALTSLYVDGAWDANSEVDGTRIATAGGQVTLIEKMTREAMCLGFSDTTQADILDTVAEYETMEERLLLGFQGSEEKYDMTVTDEEDILDQMTVLSSTWDVLKPLIVSAAQSTDGWPTAEEAEAVLPALDTSVAAAIAAADVYAFAVKRLTVNILSPMSFTGSAPYGSTLLISQMVAMDIINTDQFLLSGLMLTNHTLDDQCDGSTGLQQVTDAADLDWIALGGISCSEVCESTALYAQFARLPFVSYECASSAALSDNKSYSAFVRLGTPLSLAPSALIGVASILDWIHFTILAQPTADSIDYAENLVGVLEGGGLIVTWTSPSEDNFAAVKDMMRTVDAEKKRRLVVLGDESFFRTLLCATKVLGILPGITWVSMDSFRTSWWTQDDVDMLAMAPACTGGALSEMVQGAINIAGLGAALDEDRDRPLTCFPGFTSRNLSVLIQMHLAEGFPVGDDNAVDSPYPNMEGLGADGVCTIALATKEMLRRNYTLEDLYERGPSVYGEMIDYIRNELSFEGVSGTVKFTGNDKKGYLAITQVIESESVLAGHVSPDGIVNLNQTLVDNSSWVAAPPDPEDPRIFMYVAFAVAISGLILGPILCAAIRHCCGKTDPQR